MRKMVVNIASVPVELCGRVAGTSWADARAVRLASFPWYSGGTMQSTTARVLYDADALYVQFRCLDKHIFARTTELNGQVCQDSCVEFFATIDPSAGREYFNLEINCCGTFLLGFGPDRWQRQGISPELAGRIQIATSVAGPTKSESAGDRSWWAAAAVPLEVLSDLAGRRIRPAAGDIGRGNLYRCGGATDPQYACWNPVGTPRPDYHVPEFFGELHFA